MRQRHNKLIGILFLFGLLSASSSAYGAVNLSLKAPTSVTLNSSFDVAVEASGTGNMIGVQIKLNFDKTKVRIRCIKRAADVVTGDIDTANNNGHINVMYLDYSLVGTNVETNPELAILTFETIDKGEMQLIIDDWSAVVDMDGNDITGTRGSATVDIREVPIIAGDMDISGTINLADAILGLKILVGIDTKCINVGANVNMDEKIRLEDILYVLQMISGLRK